MHAMPELARRPQGYRERHNRQVVQGLWAPTGGESPFSPLALRSDDTNGTSLSVTLYAI